MEVHNPFITPQPWMYKDVQNSLKEYLQKYGIKSLIVGISGGFDSGFNAALAKPVCDELGIPLIGRFIHIESNKAEERERADKIGVAFCTNYEIVNLTPQYKTLATDIMLPEGVQTWEPNFGCEALGLSREQYKIALGNIKCRMRMIYLYNMAALYKGIVLDNDNKTEHMLGFWTLNGDVGDITPLASFFKTELYGLAELYADNEIKDKKAKDALYSVIDAVPTDGLGITNSDVEQFGVPSYYEVDKILAEIEKGAYKVTDECPFTDDAGIKIWNRWKNSFFKRHHPFRLYTKLD